MKKNSNHEVFAFVEIHTRPVLYAFGTPFCMPRIVWVTVLSVICLAPRGGFSFRWEINQFSCWEGWPNDLGKDDTNRHEGPFVARHITPRPSYSAKLSLSLQSGSFLMGNEVDPVTSSGYCCVLVLVRLVSETPNSEHWFAGSSIRLPSALSAAPIDLCERTLLERQRNKGRLRGADGSMVCIVVNSVW